MLNDELFTLLAGASAITTDVATRIYPVQAPEDFQYIGPFVIFSRISNKSEECHAGSAGLATARYQISAYARQKDGGNKTCRRIAENVRLLVQNYRGGSIQDCSHAGDHDSFDPELLLHHVPADWMITYSEPIPQ
jgi:hypothetical protein